MTVTYMVCGNCGHKASEHAVSGPCKVRGCPCVKFEPKKVR